MSRLKVYLSRSTQEKNITVSGKSEECHMFDLGDRVARLIDPNIIELRMNYDKNMTLKQIVQDSNDFGAQLHVALHSNAMPLAKKGTASGIEIWIHNDSIGGNEIADALIYPLSWVLQMKIRRGKEDPNTKETGVDNTGLYELDKTRASACLIELGFHDNPRDHEILLARLNKVAQVIADIINTYAWRKLNLCV